MTSVATPTHAADFDNFYEAHFGDTVAMTYGFTADLGEAQDIAQEAFCRAWLRWRELSTYDNPVAWVRRVATNLAHSRWRRLRVAAAHLVRQREPEPVPAVNPDHVAVVAALRKLPAAQRRAVVLHHLMDLPVNEVAEQLEVPVGTVKSWLHRARTALADDLRVDVRSAVTTPPAQEVVDRAGKRKRARIATAAGAMILIVLGGLAGLRFVRVDQSPQPPLGSPTPAVTPPSATPDPMESVVWSAATISLANVGRDSCPRGTVRFMETEPSVMEGPAQDWPKALFRPSSISLGDLTGDGRAEAALTVTCMLGPESDDMVPAVLIVEHVGGELVGRAWVDRAAAIVAGTWISDGILYVDHRPHPSSQKWTYELGRVSGWRWFAGKLVEVDTTARYPAIAKLDVTAVEDQLRCTGKLPTPTVTPHLLGRSGSAYEWDMAKNPAQPVFADFGRTGRPYLVLRIGCSDAVTLAVFDLVDGQWRAVAATGTADLRAFPSVEPFGEGIRVLQKDSADGFIEYEMVGNKLVIVKSPTPTRSSPGGATPSPTGTPGQ